MVPESSYRLPSDVQTSSAKGTSLQLQRSCVILSPSLSKSIKTILISAYQTSAVVSGTGRNGTVPSRLGYIRRRREMDADSVALVKDSEPHLSGHQTEAAQSSSTATRHRHLQCSDDRCIPPLSPAKQHCLHVRLDDSMRKECSKSWDVRFQEYFNKQIHPDVDTPIGRWTLERYSSGVTNDQSSQSHWTFNTGKKHLLAACSLPFTRCRHTYYINEIKRGIAGVGENHLLPVYNSLQSDQLVVHYSLYTTRSPQEIVAEIRSNGESTIPTPTVEVKKDADDSKQPARTLIIQTRAKLLLDSPQLRSKVVCVHCKGRLWSVGVWVCGQNVRLGM